MEQGARGVFTCLLEQALLGQAVNLEGNVTPAAVYAHVDKSLGAWGQRPVFKANISKLTVLRKMNPPIRQEILGELPRLFPDPCAPFPLDPAYEFTNSPEDTHELIEPYAIPENIEAFKKLQALERVGLVKPVGEEHMFFAAMHSKSCELTALGQHYWSLARRRRI